MPFTKNQVLVKSTAIADDDLANLASIKGEIAGKLGKMLVDAYKADKVVLLFKDVEKLKDSKKLAGKKALTYTVEADDKIKKIEFCVQSAKKELARVTLVDGLDKLDTGAVVVNMDKGDPTIDNASSKQAKKFGGSTAEASDESVKLSGINLKKKIVLCGHGGGPDVSGDQLYTAKQFGGRNSDQIVDFLIKQGLKPAYSGTIYLSGCHTAAGYGDPNSFASNVHTNFAVKGYKKLSVAGTPGEAWTKDGGGKGAIPSAVSEDLAKSITKSKKLLENLEKALATGTKDENDTNARIKTLDDQYADMRKLVLDMPPEAHKLLEEKLMVPLKTSRDGLVPAFKEMQTSNKSLTGAIKSEKAYLTKMETLMKDKKKLADGTISQSDYNRKEEELFTVEDWWGTFGPAKATSIKARKESETLGSLFSKFKAKFSKAKT